MYQNDAAIVKNFIRIANTNISKFKERRESYTRQIDFFEKEEKKILDQKNRMTKLHEDSREGMKTFQSKILPDLEKHMLDVSNWNEDDVLDWALSLTMTGAGGWQDSDDSAFLSRKDDLEFKLRRFIKEKHITGQTLGTLIHCPGVPPELSHRLSRQAAKLIINSDSGEKDGRRLLDRETEFPACVVCLTQKKTHAIVPCGHQCDRLFVCVYAFTASTLLYMYKIAKVVKRSAPLG